jgi:hypothetical protein
MKIRFNELKNSQMFINIYTEKRLKSYIDATDFLRVCVTVVLMLNKRKSKPSYQDDQ